jgi:hypothetical protein
MDTDTEALLQGFTTCDFRFPSVKSVKSVVKRLNPFALRCSTAKAIRDNSRNSRQRTLFPLCAPVNSIREIREIRG